MNKSDIFVIFLTQGKIALIDTDDYHLVRGYKWSASKSAYNWYAVRYQRLNGKRLKIYMHRVIARCPNGLETHHKNTNSLDNRYDNLENCTHVVNLTYRKYEVKNVDTG